ncbi:hypothetical protein LTR70_000295 [Exophiala xenobiotica]|uniref:Uncharacterized protein n=1 Tax=Lithohypha guttulata TaxID=1690604 RepID=A0ABR0K541_9EURO|nr:hypothetical protein LTR24_006730 [Lithohypha guttulata]KAK5330973.1 hypothetical protein LTR70_000295 [Exophiala xenobiotica]
MSDFASQPLPPRLTPSPQPSLEEPDPNRPPTPPLRKSIFPHPHKPTWHVNVTPYSPAWPAQFNAIHTHLHKLFTSSSPPAPYLTIEHIGSTSIPGLAAKPNIDVLVTFASKAHLASAVEALNWEIPSDPPFAKYTQIPRGGGIPGRESYKIYLPKFSPYYASTPERSVYLIADIAENREGQVQIRCYRTVRDVLRRAENGDLLEEYGEVKMRLGKEVFGNGLEYSARKDEIVRKVLARGGWTGEEVDEKEKLSRREWVVDAEEAY